MPPPPQSVTVLEASGAGHRLGYVRLVAGAAGRRGLTTRLLVPTGFERRYADEIRQHLADLLAAGAVVLHELAESPRRSAPLARALVLREALRALEPHEKLVVLDADQWLVALVTPPAWPLLRRGVVLLVMRPQPTRPDLRGRLAHAVKFLLVHLLCLISARSVVGLLATSPEDGSGRRPHARLHVVADPVINPPSDVSPAEARRAFDVPPGDVVVGILGVVSARKRPLLGLRALDLLGARTGRSVRLFLPGRVDEETRTALAAEQTAHVVVDARNATLSPETYSQAMKACDAVLVLHTNEGSSGVVTEAAAAGIPVVGGGVPSVERQVAALGAGGVVVHEMTADAVCDALVSALDKGSATEQDVPGRGAAEAAQVRLEDFVLEGLVWTSTGRRGAQHR